MAMMLELLGPPRVQVSGRSWDLPLTKPSMLLVYLAFQGDWVTREELAFFFRPDADEATGRHYVRKLLNGARAFSWLQTLEIEPKRLRWRVDSDVARFRAATEGTRWGEAVELYRGPFLSGMSVGGAPGFDAWLELEREDLAASWQHAGLQQALSLEAAGDHHRAAAMSKRLLRSDALAEEAVQSLIRNAALAGQREVALEAFESFARELERELGLRPLEETSALAARVRSGELRPAEAAPVLLARPGEDAAIRDLVALLSAPDTRLLTVLGANGGEDALVIAKRVPEASVALRAVAALAARLASEGRYRRALELALLALGHPACDERVEAELELLWPLLEAHVPRFDKRARERWRLGGSSAQDPLELAAALDSDLV